MVGGLTISTNLCIFNLMLTLLSKYEFNLNNFDRSRIDWLQQGSREVFGTILEEQVYILIDTSLSMKDKLSLVKEKLFQLMQVSSHCEFDSLLR